MNDILNTNRATQGHWSGKHFISSTVNSIEALTPHISISNRRAPFMNIEWCIYQSFSFLLSTDTKQDEAHC